MATEVASASAIAKRIDVKLAPVPALHRGLDVTPMKKDPRSLAGDKQAWVQAIVDTASKVKGVTDVNVSVHLGYEWRYFAASEGSYIEQEICTTTPSFT